MEAMVTGETPVVPTVVSPAHSNTELRAPAKRSRTDATLSSISGESLKEALVAAFATSHSLNMKEMEFRFGRIPKKGKLDEIDVDEPEHPVLLLVENHTIRDDAHKEIDFVARSVRPLQCDPSVWWAEQKRVARPIKEDLEDTHLTASSVNPRTVMKLHDRGAELNNKMFLSSNVGVEQRQGKMKFNAVTNEGTYLLDYAEPQGVWQVN